MEAAVRKSPTENRLIALLPEPERERLMSDLDIVSLGIRDAIAEPREPFRHIYFPLDLVISLVIELEDGGMVEVATVGKEGMVGVPVVLGSDESPTRVFCQVAGDSVRMKTAAFKQHLQAAPHFNRLMHRYAQAMINQVSQTAACNHGHEIEQRMCRWLLMTQDRVGREEFGLTQEFMAQMLGVRRPSVTVVAGMLQKAGLITYSRGRVKVLNRAGLEAASCECYRRVKDTENRLLSG